MIGKNICMKNLGMRLTKARCMKYRECYENGRSILKEAGIEEADWDARLLLEHVCQTTRNDLLVHGERLVEEEKQVRFEELIAQRAKRIPLQHLTKVQEFMGLEFKVNEHVLIPRQDTEILVEEVLSNLHDGMRVLDMCTGSGCIIISLLKYSNDCCGVGVDISGEALEIAKENAKQHLTENGELLTFLQSDLFEKVTGIYEIIVSNPPYIPSGVIPTLMPEVRDYEPMQALDGKADGLFFYRKIIEESRNYLTGGGMLYFEIGHDQAEEVSTLMEESGFAEINIVKDYAGLDRVLYGTFIK